MNIKQQENAIRLFALLVVGISIIIIMIFQNKAYAQSVQVRYHQKLQKERSYEFWRSNQPKIRIKAVKAAVKQSKEVNGHNNQMARLVRKEDRIRKGIVK